MTATLVVTVLFAAFVNGGIGYGFSSITVPIALLFYSNRVLNPALVLVEVIVNMYILILNHVSTSAPSFIKLNTSCLVWYPP